MHMPNVSGMNIADELIKIAENASFTDQLMYNALHVYFGNTIYGYNNYDFGTGNTQGG